MLFLNFTYLHNFNEAVKAGAAIFSVWMVVKVFAAASVYFAVSKNSSLMDIRAQNVEDALLFVPLIMLVNLFHQKKY